MSLNFGEKTSHGAFEDLWISQDCTWVSDWSECHHRVQSQGEVVQCPEFRHRCTSVAMQNKGCQKCLTSHIIGPIRSAVTAHRVGWYEWSTHTWMRGSCNFHADSGADVLAHLRTVVVSFGGKLKDNALEHTFGFIGKHSVAGHSKG